MDQTNSNRICKRHTNGSLEFIQVKNVSQTTNKDLFYCSSCINEDLQFKGIDHILIHQIATQGETHIIQKWPPIDNQQIIEQLIKVTANAQSHSTAEQSITNFFSVLKNEISNHIDTCQKKMVNLIKHQSFDGESIIQEYQTISQICELRKLLFSGNQADLYAKEEQLKQFILSIEEKNINNTERLKDLLSKSQKQQSILNFELPNQIKESILTFIDEINFFNTESSNASNFNDEIQSNQPNKQDSITDKIMKLISNKSNYCSDEFLKEIQMKLSKLNCLLTSLSFEHQFKENKQPIQFEELTTQQLDLLDAHVKHLSQMQKDQEYLEELKNQKQVKSLKAVLNNKSNFISSNFIDDFEGYLIETYPYLRNIEFENMITQVERFNKIMNVSEEAFINLLNQPEQLNNLIQIASNISNSDLTDIMPIIQLEKGNHKNGDQNQMIQKINNSIEISNLSDEDWYNCVSNINLEKDKKYIFRFQIQKLDSNQKDFVIGLMKEEYIHHTFGYDDKLCCYFKSEKNSDLVELYPFDCGIYKDINENGFKMNTLNNEEIELRVCIEDQVLQVLDYPKYTCKIGISDSSKDNLINFNPLKLYISQGKTNQKIILKSAFIAKSW